MNLVRLARAFAFGAPLAFLASSFIGPPDPFSQLVNIGLGIVLFVPAAYLSVAESGTSRTLVAFYGVILLLTLLGVLVVGAVNGGQELRVLVLVAAVVAGAVVANRVG